MTQSALRAHPGRRKRRAFLAAEPARAPQTIVESGLGQDAARGNIDRLAGLVPDERILVLTNVDQEAAVRELLPDLPPENIRGRAGEARHGCGRGPRHGLGRGARSSRDDDGAAGGSCDQGSGGIPKDDADGDRAPRKRPARWSRSASSQPGPARDLATSNKARPRP